MAKVKLIGVINDEPFSLQTWSGSSYFLFKALQEKNVLQTAFSAKSSKYVDALAKLLAFSPVIDKWKFKYNLSLFNYQNMTKLIVKKIKAGSDDFNTILQIGAWYDTTSFKKKGKIVASYHDGNLAALLNSPFGYPNISKRYINNVLEYEKKLYSKIDILFPMSKWLADSFYRDFSVPYDKMEVVGVGANFSEIPPNTNKLHNEPNILFVGVNFTRKGGGLLLRAFEEVRKEIPSARLKIVSAYVPKTPIKNVDFIGLIDKNTTEGANELLKLYQWASVFVMPSLYEPFGIVFLEAMAHQIPCVGTNICAIPEIISDNKTGFVVEPKNVKMLSSRIMDVLKNPVMAQEMGMRGYEKYSQHYTWSTVCGKMINQLERLL